MSNEEKPRFVHDCVSCAFLGYFNGHDLYFCPKQVGGPTVIARYGTLGKYCSGMPFATPEGIPELYEAKKRAIAKGLIQ